MKYQVAFDDDLPGLIRKVNEAMRGGWRPQGGITVAVNARGNPAYFQAMVHD